MTKKMFLIVAYDIESNRRRNKLTKLLKDFEGRRVNFSVFECRIKRGIFPLLKQSVKEIINIKKDSVLFYDLCLNCEQKREVLGTERTDNNHTIIQV
jgi:CRISPR-associated protein Cas2